MLLKIIGVGVCTIAINLFLKQYKPELALLVNVCGGLLIFLMVIEGAGQLIEYFIDLQNVANIKVDVVSPILKVIGIGYITEFASDMAEDCGNKSIANKIILGGKVAVCVIALPILQTLIEAIMRLI